MTYGTSNPHVEARQHFAAIDESHKSQGFYQGHHSDGGLQKHSIGESYPFAVIGTLDAQHRTVYYVRNLETGINYYRHDGQFYNTSASAHGYAAFLKSESEAT